MYQAWIFFLDSIVVSGAYLKIDIVPRAPGRWCHVIDPNCCKNKTKAPRPEAIDCADGSVPPTK